nr:PBECR2 nuclease fold domain-containing protein [Helicobacter ailurogastricus]
MRVFDSKDFFKRLNQLQEGKDGIFKSPAAQEFINLAKGFNRLFINDALLARNIKPATSEKIGSSIATSIEGAVKYQLIKEAFSHLVRLAPYIPMATGFNEKVAGAALRYHLKSALSKSHTVSQFKTHLNAVVAKQPFDNKTKQLIREFLKGFDEETQSVSSSSPSGGDGGPAGPTPPTTPPKGDIEGTNPKGNEPQNPTSGLEQAWLETFGLKSLDEPFIPKFSPEVAKALEPVLKGEQIQLTQGSLIKLEKRQREEFLPLIRPTLEEPNAVLDNGRGILFIKEFIDPDKNRYFMSVAKNYDGEWIFSSHMRKDFSAIKNEFSRSKVLYNSGFKGGEVASASDILESGGTAVKPSDLQIDTPPNRGSGLNPKSEDTTTPLLADLSPQEIQEAVKKWDLTNPKPTDSLDFALVKDPELRELQEVFNTDKLIRQIRSAEVKDTLDKGFSLKEVLDYTSHLPTAQRNILGDELHYTKPLENGKTLNIVETYKAPKTLRFSRMDVVEDRGVATAQRQIDNPPPPKGDNPPPKGNEPQNPTSGLEQAWLETFGLKSLDEPFIPQFSKEVQAALEPILQGEQIQLTQGSLIKLEKRERDSLLPHIRPALEQSDMVLRDKENALIFVKDIGKTYYLTSVARKSDGTWTIRTNSYKTLNRLKNIVADSGEVLHVDEKAPNQLAETFKVKAFSNQLEGKDSTKGLKIEANPAFGENFAEYAGKGAEAVKKLLQEKRGQVSGAFYRPDLGAITLAWGEAGTGKSDGWGLSKIAKYHPEVLDKLEELIQTLPIVKETPNRYQLENATYKASIRKDFEKKPGNWVLTAFEKRESIAKRSTDLPSTQEGAKKTPLADTTDNNTTTPLKAQEDATPKSAEELIESLAVDNATAKKYNKHYPHDPRYILSDQHEAFKKLFGIKEGDDPFTPNMPKEVLEALQTAQEKPFKVRSKDFYFGLTDGYAPYFKQTLEHPDAVFQDEFFMYLVKNIDGKIFAFRAENSTDAKYFERLYPYELEDLQESATQLGNGVKAKTKRQFIQEERARKEARLKTQAKQEEAKANKPPIKKPKDYKQPQSLEGLEELPKITPKSPINQSFGKNYSRYTNKGQEGLLALMFERTMLDGQIANLYTRPEIGGIDVWTQHYNMGVADSELKGNQLRYYHDNLKLGLETFKAQPQEFLTPVGREAQIRAKKDFKKWRNMHIANAIDRTIKEGDLSRKGNSVELNLRETYNGKDWDFKARIDWTNNNDPSQPRRWVLQDFKVDGKEPPKPSKGGGNNKKPFRESGVKPSAVIQSPEEKEAFIKSLDLRTSATPIPASLDVEGFLKSLKGVKNHKRFIEHLASREDKQRRLGFLNLVEPTLNHPDFVMLNNDVGRKKYVKVFQKDNAKHLTYLLVTAEDDKLLITGIPDVRRSYIIKEIKDADIIYSFIRPGS